MSERMPSEEYSIVGVIDPDYYANASTNKTDSVDMSKFSKVMAIVMRGAATTNASLAAKMQFSATSNGTFTTGLTGKYITTWTSSGKDDSQAIINLMADEVRYTTKKWMNVKMTIATTKCYAAVIVLGKPIRTEAWTTIAANDLASVVEIVG